MNRHGGQVEFRTAWTAAACAALLVLTACAGAPAGGARYVDNPSEWKAIAPAEADLNLPLVAPLEIASVERRMNDSKEHQEIYTFEDVEGYVKTTRLAAGIYPEAYARSLKAGGTRSRSYIAGLSLPSADKIDALPFGFLNGKSLDGNFLSRGFTAEGSARPRYTNCFVARTAYLMVDLKAIKRTPDAVDTVVEVLLCGNRGDLPPPTDLVQMLVRVDVVADRDAFRQELGQHRAGSN